MAGAFTAEPCRWARMLFVASDAVSVLLLSVVNLYFHSFFFFFFFFLVFRDRVYLYSPGCPGKQTLDKAGL